jgi:hypothetical protein
VEGVKKVAPSYCLGCTFSMLNHIWNYNHDTPTRSSMSSSSPNPKPLCLKVCLPRH